MRAGRKTWDEGTKTGGTACMLERSTFRPQPDTPHPFLPSSCILQNIPGKVGLFPFPLDIATLAGQSNPSVGRMASKQDTGTWETVPERGIGGGGGRECMPAVVCWNLLGEVVISNRCLPSLERRRVWQQRLDLFPVMGSREGKGFQILFSTSVEALPTPLQRSLANPADTTTLQTRLDPGWKTLLPMNTDSGCAHDQQFVMEQLAVYSCKPLHQVLQISENTPTPTHTILLVVTSHNLALGSSFSASSSSCFSLTTPCKQGITSQQINTSHERDTPRGKEKENSPPARTWREESRPRQRSSAARRPSPRRSTGSPSP